MPQDVKYKTLEFEVNISKMPSTIEEYDAGAGEEGACFARACQHYLDHSHSVKVRAAIAKALEDYTGFKRAREEDGEKTKFTETEGKYVERLSSYLEEEGRSLTDDDIVEVVQNAANTIPVDLSKSTRGAGGTGKVAKKWLDQVEAFKAKGKYDMAVAKYGITLTDDEDQNDRMLAAAIKDVITKKLAAAQKEALAAIEAED